MTKKTVEAQEPNAEDWKGGSIAAKISEEDAAKGNITLDAAKSSLPDEAKSIGEVATIEKGGAVDTARSFDELLSEDAGVGQDAMSLEDLAIPRLSVLQPLSPQILEGKTEYLGPDAKAGMVYDSVSKKVYSGASGIRVIPVAFRRAYIEWIVRKQGGGFVADWDTDATVLERTTKDEDTGQLLTKEGHEIVVTYEYYVYVYNDADNSVFQAVISMAKSQAPKARAWNTMINQLEIESPKGSGKMINPAMFYRSYVLTTKPEQNESGAWFGWIVNPSTVVPDLPRGTGLYLKAREFYKDILAGKVKVAAPVEMAGGAGGKESDEDPM